MNVTELFSKAEDFYAPSKALAELGLTNAEKLAELNLAALKANTELAMNTWKAALEVKDMESAKNFFEAQRDVAEASVKRAEDNAKSVAALGREYIEGVTKLTEANLKNAKKKAA